MYVHMLVFLYVNNKNETMKKNKNEKSEQFQNITRPRNYNSLMKPQFFFVIYCTNFNMQYVVELKRGTWRHYTIHSHTFSLQP